MANFGLALHLVARSAEGIWRAVQALGPDRERAGYWREPAGTFRDRLGQFCWRAPSGRIFCSDLSGDLRHHGVVENEEALRGLGFEPVGGAPIDGCQPRNEDGAAEATPPVKF